MNKFLSKKWFVLAVATSLIYGLEVPFNTATYAYIFTLITSKDVAGAVKYLVIVLSGYLFFEIIRYIKSRVVNRNIVEVNVVLKDSYVHDRVKNVLASTNAFESKSLSFFMNDLKLLEDNYFRNIFSIVGYITTVLVTLSYSLYSNAIVTLIFLVFMIVPAVIQRYSGKSIPRKTEKWSKANGSLSAVVKGIFHGAFTIVRYFADDGYDKHLKQKIKQAEVANADMKNAIVLSNSIMVFLFYIFSETPIAIGIYLTIKGVLTLPQFVAIQYSSNMIMNYINSIVTSLSQVSSTKSIREQMKNIPIFHEKEDKALIIKNTKINFESLKIENLSFGYDKKNVISDINLNLNRGEKILIRGASGSGKSTFLRLLLKELTPRNGEIRLNQGAYSSRDAGELLSTVSQEPIIFPDTVKFNLTLGFNVSNKTIQKVLESVGLQNQFQDKNFEDKIEENGSNLSGGQLKRIEIARALIFNRQVLLLDEGTASLDPETALQIHNVLFGIPELTLVEVDHHIPDEMLPKYDHVFNLEKGRLVAE